jgi:hypothetical protein
MTARLFLLLVTASQAAEAAQQPAQCTQAIAAIEAAVKGSPNDYALLIHRAAPISAVVTS